MTNFLVNQDVLANLICPPGQTPKWAYDLEREIMMPARLRLEAAKQELYDAEQAEAAAFDHFQREYNKRLSERI